MGEPAIPTPAERAATLDLARSIVDAVRNDEESPTKYMRGSAIDGTIFRFAQDLLDTRRALDEAIATAFEIDDWAVWSSDAAIEFREELTSKLERLQRLDFEAEEQPKLAKASMKRVIIESPLAGDVARNKRYLTACIRDSLMRGEAPFASHAIYVGPLDDDKREERDLGIAAGFAWRSAAELTAVYEDLGISRGMQLGIEAAEAMGHPIDRRKLGDEWDRTIALEVGCEVEWQPLFANGRARGQVVRLIDDGAVHVLMSIGLVYFEAHERGRLSVVRPAPTRTPGLGTAVQR